MDMRLQTAYAAVLSKYRLAIVTDEKLGYTDNPSRVLENKSRQYWADFEAAGAEFRALLDKCVLP